MHGRQIVADPPLNAFFLCRFYTRVKPPITSAYFGLGMTMSATGGSVQHRWYLEESCSLTDWFYNRDLTL
jgi:hypothetical protein